MVINAKCSTNLDDYKLEKWPTLFPAVPSVGQYVRSQSGKVLKITSLTWSMNGFNPDSHPCSLLIDLNK